MTPDNEEKLRQFNAEWDQQYSTDDTKPPIDSRGGGNSNLLDSVKGTANLMPNNAPYVPAAIPTTGDSCSQCGTMHPPIRPGETCPVAAEMKGNQPEAVAAPHVPAQEVHKPQPVTEPLTEGDTKTEVKPVNEAPVRPAQPPPAPVPQKEVVPSGDAIRNYVDTNPETVSEPAPLTDNNIPTEIHVNKYLASWGQQIDIYCKNNNVKNVKKLMRHLTVEVTNFLDYYKEV